VTAATGLTVTVKEKGSPVQVPETGVTVKVAVCGGRVELTSVPVMLDPLPASPREPPPVGADQM
jgi:hypothetical protein